MFIVPWLVCGMISLILIEIIGDIAKFKINDILTYFLEGPFGLLSLLIALLIITPLALLFLAIEDYVFFYKDRKTYGRPKCEFFTAL